MNTRLPYGGKVIADLRASHRRPADMVLISLIGPLDEINPVILANPTRFYDWKFISGLDVMIVANLSVDRCLVKAISEAVAAFKPTYLGVWLGDIQNGAHIAFAGFRPKTKSFRWMSPRDRKSFQGLGQ